VSVTTPTQGTVCNSNAESSHGKPVYKRCGRENLNRPLDHNHAPFRDGCRPFSVRHLRLLGHILGWPWKITWCLYHCAANFDL